MSPARTYPERRDDVRLLVVDPVSRAVRATRTPEIPNLLAAGDVLVVNDAATVPASLAGRDEAGHPFEVRLIARDHDRDGDHFWAVLLGEGDWHAKTEDRPTPAIVATGTRLAFGALSGEVVAVSPLSAALVSLRFLAEPDAMWAALYREGRPVQYSYLAHDLPLWAVQTVYAARPWAFEMPSAGRPFSWEILLALRQRGVRLASVTHAAGLSSTGHASIDAALPLPEAFEIPATTVAAIREAHQSGCRVIAVGTTVVRALEGAAARSGALEAGSGITDLRIGSGHPLRVVDGLFTGIHVAGESHFELLRAFASADLLGQALAYAEAHGFTTHELGDAMLVLPSVATDKATTYSLRGGEVPRPPYAACG